MQRLEVSCAVRLLHWSLGVKGLRSSEIYSCKQFNRHSALPEHKKLYKQTNIKRIRQWCGDFYGPGTLQRVGVSKHE